MTCSRFDTIHKRDGHTQYKGMWQGLCMHRTAKMANEIRSNM